MGAKTGIEWTDATWNPIIGCSRVSEGCRNCYAETIAARFGGGKPTVYSGLTQVVNGHAVWTGKIVETKQLLQPLSWRKPKRVFVNSMSDLFHENVSDELIDRIFAVMALCPQHTFQVLTKRPARMLAYITRGIGGIVRRDFVNAEFHHLNPTHRDDQHVGAWPLPNVWLGVSVEHQAAADERIPLLLKTPAARWFISAEPLLSALDVSKWMYDKRRAGVLSADDTGMVLDRAGNHIQEYSVSRRRGGEAAADQEATSCDQCCEKGELSENHVSVNDRDQDESVCPSNLVDGGESETYSIPNGNQSYRQQQEELRSFKSRVDDQSAKREVLVLVPEKEKSAARINECESRAGRSGCTENTRSCVHPGNDSARDIGTIQSQTVNGELHSDPQDLDPYRVGLDWVICGGESGPGARPMHPDWARSLRDQCAAAGVPFFFKQWGVWVPGQKDQRTASKFIDGVFKTGDIATNEEWGRDGDLVMHRVFKHEAGALLDGVEHKCFPELPCR